MSEQDMNNTPGGPQGPQRGPEDAELTGLTGGSGVPSDAAEVEGAAGEAPAAGRGASSVQLRSTGESSAALMDPANQSLAEALRITFRLLMLGMVVLGVFFVFSGVTRVQEGQRGLALLFGKVVDPNVEPGLRFAPPFPIGELERVGTGQQQVRLDEEFTPQNSSGRAVAQWNAPQSLSPDGNNYHLTGDLNIAHSQWTLVYSREQHEEFAENIAPQAEDRIVRAVTTRSIMHAVAETPIDDLLKASAGEANSVASRARQLAQRELESIGSGIRVVSLSMRTRVPPGAVAEDFNAVQAATSAAAQAAEEAAEFRNTLLSNVAGAAARPLVDQIDEYERQLALGDLAAASAVFEQIHALIDGRQAAEGALAASGEVTETVNQAEADRSRTVQQARADLATFQAALAGYRENPQLLIARTWGSALGDLLAQPWVEKFVLPEGAEPRIDLNRDPQIERDLIQERRAREVMETTQERVREIFENEGRRRGRGENPAQGGGR